MAASSQDIVLNLSNASFGTEWEQIPAATVGNLMESLKPERGSPQYCTGGGFAIKCYLNIKVLNY